MRARVIWAVFVGLLGVGAAVGAPMAVRPPAPAAKPTPPGSLELVGKNPLESRGMNAALAVHGRYAYVGSRTDGPRATAGVFVVDLDDPGHPHVVGQIGPPEEGNPGESSRELRVWPEQELLIVMNFECDEVGHACAGAATTDPVPELRFYDIRGEHAARPRLLSTYRPSHNPHEFFLWQDPRRPGRALLYISTPFTSGADIDQGGRHLIVTDISRAREGRFAELAKWSPQRDGRHKAAGLHSLSVSRDGRRAYLADLEGGFAMADTSDLADGSEHPRIRQLTPADRTVHRAIPGVHSALALPGRRFAFITDEVYGKAFGTGPLIGFNVLQGCPWGWSRVIDVRDPAAPRVVGEYKVLPYNDPSRCSEFSPTQENGASFSSHNPTLTPDLALVTWHSAGLQVASIADPAHPAQAAAFRPDPLPAVQTEDPALSSGTEKVVMWSYPIVKDGLIHVVDIRNGLYVLRYRGPFATELGCYSFLEGNSNLERRVPGCGLRLRLALRYRRGRRGCARSAVRATLRGADRRRLRRVDFLIRGRRVASDRTAPFSRRIARRRLSRRRRTRIAAVATVEDGSRVTFARRVRRCRRPR